MRAGLFPARGGSSLNRPPATLVLLTLAGAGLGVWMALDGLHARLFGVFLNPPGLLSLWLLVPRLVGADPSALAMPLVVAGTAWLGAVSALWIGLDWGERAAMVLGVLSLLYLGVGTALAALTLGCLAAPPTRRWLAAARQSHAP